MTKRPQPSRKPESLAFPYGETVQPEPLRPVEYVPIASLKECEDSPRVHDQASIETLARMIMSTRIMASLIVDEQGRVLAGVARLAAARLLGMTEVPVQRAEGRSEAELKLFRIADNRAVELGRWDERLLAVEIKGLADLKPNFSLEASGFTFAEIDIKLESLNARGDDSAEDPGDIIPAIPVAAIARIGEIFLLGKHRVMCGSARDALAMQLLMGGQSAQMVIGDPPYNVSITKHAGGKGRIRHAEFAQASGELSPTEFTEWLTCQLEIAASCCVPGAYIYNWMDWRSIDRLMEAARAVDLEHANTAIWVKSQGGMGTLYRSRYKMAAIFRKPGGPSKNRVQLGKFGRTRENVWFAPGANSFGKTRASLSSHPTPKAVGIIADAIRDVTDRGDVVLDNFLGSGTTIIAAERTDRIGFGMEIEPRYVDVAVRRWEEFTGREAVHEASGLTFRALAVERLAAQTASPSSISDHLEGRA